MPDPMYLSITPAPVLNIEVNHLNRSPHDSWEYQIKLGMAGYLHLSAKDTDDLFLVLCKRLYDDNNLSMETAERVNYMTMVALQDPREAEEAARMEAGEDI